MGQGMRRAFAYASCTGDAGCKSIVHIHGCFEDRGECLDPDAHGDLL